MYSTSVNRSGSPVLENESEIVKEFEDEVDLIVLDGNKNNALPSTIVSFNNALKYKPNSYSALCYLGTSYAYNKELI